MRPLSEDTLLAQIGLMLQSGLQTTVEPFPETHVDFANILSELRKLSPDDVKGKLVIAGFATKPYGLDHMRCLECMYYLVHRQWCDLPELDLPVDPDWYCRLWRI